MPRRARTIVGGYAYHILNRANGRLRLFKKDADFAAFQSILGEAQRRVPLRILGYVAMSNHWHFLVWPRRDESTAVSEFFRWLTVTHAQRWHAHHGTGGTGHVYQGRFKSFPVATDEYLLGVLRYIERNPLRAGMVRRAEDWRWGSLHQRLTSDDDGPALCDSPIELGADWTARVNEPQTEVELAAICRCAQRGQPYGPERWVAKATGQLGLQHTFRPRGRPKLPENQTPIDK